MQGRLNLPPADKAPATEQLLNAILCNCKTDCMTACAENMALNVLLCVENVGVLAACDSDETEIQTSRSRFELRMI